MNVSFQQVKTAHIAEKGCVVFSIVRNEMHYLPASLEHYRGLDAAGFLVRRRLLA